VITYLLRHGQTPFSASYRVNGDPRLALFLDETGREQCRLARSAILVAEIRSCVTSGFPRAFQTAKLMLERASVSVTSDWQLDELDYGAFEGRPFTEYAAWLGQHGPRASPPAQPSRSARASGECWRACGRPLSCRVHGWW
jgi:probable phosphoglycerate mutase